MKKVICTLLFAGSLFAAHSQIKTPAPSPAQTVKQEFGLGTLEWSYSRPGLKGRTLYKDLAPEGKVWRTGANGATTLTVSDEVTIGGKTLAAGTYGLLTIPGKSSWTVIITKQTDVTSPAAYKESEDIVRIQVTPRTADTPVETFTIALSDVSATSAELQLLWDRTIVPIPVSTNIDTRIMAAIDASLKSEKPAYYAAASYYLDNGKDINKAIDWFSKAVAAQPDAFWIQHQYAKALAKAGKKKEAVAAAEKSIELAKKANNEDYVRNNEQLISTLK